VTGVQTCALPILRYADVVTDGAFDVEFRVVTEANGDKLVVDVKKRNEPGVAYQQFSGGERRRADVIVLLRLHDLVLSRLGREISLRVFDEVFENVDGEGVENISALFQLFAENEAIYVVSHNPSLVSQFNNVVTVRKRNGVSTLVWNATFGGANEEVVEIDGRETVFDNGAIIHVPEALGGGGVGGSGYRIDPGGFERPPRIVSQNPAAWRGYTGTPHRSAQDVEESSRPPGQGDRGSDGGD